MNKEDHLDLKQAALYWLYEIIASQMRSSGYGFNASSISNHILLPGQISIKRKKPTIHAYFLGMKPHKVTMIVQRALDDLKKSGQLIYDTRTLYYREATVLERLAAIGVDVQNK